jgi:hypothetical protein
MLLRAAHFPSDDRAPLLGGSTHATLGRSCSANPHGARPVNDSLPDIVLATERIDSDTLRTLLHRFFEDMVKYVVDVERGVVAVGGELHADAEACLIEDGSRQQDLWGANYYPGLGADACIEFTSLINIRPAQGNRSMEIEDLRIRERVREITSRLIGSGEALS